MLRGIVRQEAASSELSNVFCSHLLHVLVTHAEGFYPIVFTFSVSQKSLKSTVFVNFTGGHLDISKNIKNIGHRFHVSARYCFQHLLVSLLQQFEVDVDGRLLHDGEGGHPVLVGGAEQRVVQPEHGRVLAVQQRQHPRPQPLLQPGQVLTQHRHQVSGPYLGK